MEMASDIDRLSKKQIAINSITLSRNEKLNKLAREACKSDSEKDEDLIEKIRSELSVLREDRRNVEEDDAETIDRVSAAYIAKVKLQEQLKRKKNSMAY